MDERVMLVMAMLSLQDYCQCTSRGSGRGACLGPRLAPACHPRPTSGVDR